MKKFTFFLFSILINTSFFAQKSSYFIFKIQTNVLKNDKIIAAKTQNKICFIKKRTTLSNFNFEDTVLVKTPFFYQNKKKIARYNAFLQSQKFIIELEKDKINGTLHSNLSRLAYFPATSKNTTRNNFKKDFSTKIQLDFKDKSSQEFVFPLDSFSVTQKIVLDFPICITKKTSKTIGGIVSVYYRSALEHLNKNTYSASSAGKVLDFGHAFIGAKDLKTNKLYFLDGWPDAKWQEGNQHFTWNENVDSIRTSDHHSISFNISAKDLAVVVKQIENYKTACIEYEMIDFNCTDATTQILEKIGLYTRKDQSNTVFPASFAAQLMEKLNKLQICYEFDGMKIR